VKIRSFRLRIALLSAGLAGVALIGFAAIAWQFISVAKINQLDVKLENHVRRSTRPRSLKILQDTHNSPLRDLNAETALLAIDATDKPLYQTANWSADFVTDHLFPPRPPELPSREDRSDAESAPRSAPPELPVRFITRRTATGNWRIGATRTPDTQLAIAVSLRTIDQEMAAIGNIFGVVIPGTLLLVAGGAWGLSGSVLRPVRRLTSVMQQLTVSHLDQRLPIGSTDTEFVQLIQVFNHMLERLERSFKQASRFSADAAHELKTPLAILQGELEQALQQAESGSEEQQRLSDRLDEVRRLSSIVRKLLLLSLADSGQMGIHRLAVDLSAILAMMVEDLELFAPHLSVQTDVTPGLEVWGDRDLLTQVLQNLTSNAIKYNVADGWIRIHAKQNAATVQVTIANASQDIPATDCDRIFDRFYRGDPARTRKVEGIGLGLSLSREIARAHGGDLRLDVMLSKQTAFVLTLPTNIADQSPPSPEQPQQT
jgi:two-component system, OmpR family, heavy metal sensor histidine kinase CusS